MFDAVLHDAAMFQSFYLRGFGVAAHPWFCRVLEYNCIRYYNLTPTSIHQVAIFVYFCEAFLGIYPHFALWCSMFELKPMTEVTPIRVVGNCNFVLSESRIGQYIDMRLRAGDVSWRSRWFYLENVVGILPEDVDFVPVCSPAWSRLPGASVVRDVEKLLTLIWNTDADVVVVTLNFVGRRYQPLKERVFFAWEYYDKSSTREAAKALNKLEKGLRFHELFDPQVKIANKGRQTAYSLENVRPTVRVTWYLSFVRCCKMATDLVFCRNMIDLCPFLWAWMCLRSG